MIITQMIIQNLTVLNEFALNAGDLSLRPVFDCSGATGLIGIALKNNGVWGRVPTKTDTKNQYTRPVLNAQKATLHPKVSCYLIFSASTNRPML
jgi:hypothetical protein